MKAGLALSSNRNHAGTIVSYDWKVAGSCPPDGNIRRLAARAALGDSDDGWRGRKGSPGARKRIRKPVVLHIATRQPVITLVLSSGRCLFGSKTLTITRIDQAGHQSSSERSSMSSGRRRGVAVRVARYIKSKEQVHSRTNE